MEQVHEYDNFTGDVLNEGMEMYEIFQANVLLKKFPTSSSDYRNQLNHKKKNLTLQKLISHMRTEEANSNLVESGSTFVKDRFKGKQKKSQKKGYVKKQSYFNKPEGQIQKSKGPCYVCENICHKAFQCNQRQGQSSKQGGKTPPQANLTESGDMIVVVVVEANMVANKTYWILDTGASRHLCANKELFHDFEDSTDGECVYMGNSTTAGVMGKGKVFLKLTSEKTLALNNVLYVSSIHRNLVSGTLLNKAGLKLIFESNKIIISHGGDFIRKSYLNGGLFVLNIIQEITSNASTSNTAYIAESIDLWHDLADFKNTVSKGGKKYYITFADDFSRYTKHVFPLKYNVPTDLPNNTSTSISVNSHIVPSSSITANDHENALRRSKRCRIEASFGHDFITTFLTENIELDLLNYELVSTYLIEEDPKTYDEAMSKWIFKKKLRPDSTIEKYKVRLVIRDFNQKKGVDYFDTYSPVTKIATIRTLVALAAIHNLVIHQMDVKMAFLNGDLEEEIYMTQPEGFVIQGQENKVCKLRKFLYGLKHAPKQWYEKFNSILVDNGFVVNASYTCVYSKMI
ncbi:uncharacterized protein LOC142178271 [Nicotiana tabacum]|uniref:Uncharacterized protein LOC142178271 n=1 Tax=Nicotiana tabacum TaxID=4097 RepID=A0AC58U2I6_TOBAC